jgi:phosphonate transport system substrate-binding protein
VRLKLVLGLLAGLLMQSLVAHAEDEISYSIGVTPQFGQKKISIIWNPIIKELSRRTGLQFRLVIPRTISEFEESMEKGNFDFIYASPYQILRLSDSPGYIPLVKDKTPLRGILVVRRDSPITKVKELEGKSLAVPAPNALGASLLLRSDLERLYGVHMTLVDENTHNAAYLSVIYKETDAAGGVKKTLDEQEKNIRDELRILYTTRAMPSHPIAVHPRINKKIQLSVKKALMEMSKNAASKLLLKEVPMDSPVSASLDDYLVMRNWGLEEFWILNKK